jgi:hypothetical protein
VSRIVIISNLHAMVFYVDVHNRRLLKALILKGKYDWHAPLRSFFAVITEQFLSYYCNMRFNLRRNKQLIWA